MSLSKFLTVYFLYTLSIAAIAAVAQYLNPDVSVLVPRFWLVFIFTAGITLIAYLLVWIGNRKGGDAAIYSIMGSITIKLLVYLAFILVYIKKIGAPDKLLFIGNFFSLYFLFTVFEIYSLLRNLRNQKF